MKNRRFTDEMLADIAVKYHCSSEFEKGDSSAYRAALERGILKDITGHFHPKHVHWDEKRLWDIVDSCANLADLGMHYPGAVLFAKRNGLYNLVVEKMGRKPVVYTKDIAIEIVSHYSTMVDFRKNEKNCYQFLQKNGLINEVCGHLERTGDFYRRAIYVFEFDTHAAYIGLSKNPRERLRDHLWDKNSAVYQYLQEHHCQYNFKCLTDYIDGNEAALKENEYIEKYRSEGWTVLNREKGGSLGWSAKRKYSLEYLIEHGRRYKNRKEFKKHEMSLYNYASKYHCLDVVCAHMPKYKNQYQRESTRLPSISITKKSQT